MVDAILLVLREVLEAALIITILMVMSRKLGFSLHWILVALVMGTLSSWALAHYAYTIADALGGTGQEWTNALLYFMVVLAFIVIATFIAPLLFNTPPQLRHLAREDTPRLNRQLLVAAAIFAVGLSLAREVAEIWIYLGGFAQQPDKLESALTGGAIGLGIGASLGAITYYLLVFISVRRFIYLLFSFLILLSGGLAMQIAKQLLQIGVLDSAAPLWDTSRLVNEHSWLGELLYALIGYDSSPSAIQVIFYWLAVTPLIVIGIWQWRRRKLAHA